MVKIALFTLVFGMARLSFGQQQPLQILHAVELRFQTEAGKTYQLESSNSMDGPWEASRSPFVGTGSIISAFDSISTAQRFYRLSIVTPDADLVRFYSFEGSLIDSVTGKNASAFGNPRFINRGQSTAVQFNGSTDYLTIDPIAPFQEGTVCGWVRWDGFGFYSRFFDFGIMNQSFHVFNLETTERLGFDLQFEDETNVDVDYPLTAGVWQHIALTISATRGAVLYVNGHVQGFSPSLKETFADLPPNSQYFLAKSTFPADALLSGAIDNVRIYKRALIPEEIKAIYEVEK